MYLLYLDCISGVIFYWVYIFLFGVHNTFEYVDGADFFETMRIIVTANLTKAIMLLQEGLEILQVFSVPVL